jgi:hypothetical protein
MLSLLDSVRLHRLCTEQAYHLSEPSALAAMSTKVAFGCLQSELRVKSTMQCNADMDWDATKSDCGLLTLWWSSQISKVSHVSVPGVAG